MGIERIRKIKNHRIFRGFLWPNDLPDFKEKNLFYGWNGSGKSTLSNLFRFIEKRTAITEGEVEFVISGNKIDGMTLAQAKGYLKSVFSTETSFPIISLLAMELLLQYFS